MPKSEIMLSSDIIDIDKELIESAQEEASKFSSPLSRKRAAINLLGIKCALKFFETTNVEISTVRSIHSIPILSEEFKINDIYCNGWRIDVITLYKNGYIKTPRIHLDCDILPDFYFVVQIGAKMEEAKILGFFDSETIKSSPCNVNDCFPQPDLMFGLDEFLMRTKRPAPAKSSSDKHDECTGSFFKFIDRKLSLIYKSQLINHLISCEDCMNKFLNVLEFHKVSSDIDEYQDLKVACEQPYLFNSFTYESMKDKSESIDKIYSGYNEQEDDVEDTAEKEEASNEKTEINEKNNLLGESGNRILKKIFNNKKSFEIPQLMNFKNKKAKKHYILIGSGALVIFLLLAVIALNSLAGIKKNNEDPYNIDNLPSIEDFYANDYETSRQAQLISNESNPPHQARLISSRNNMNDLLAMRPTITRPSYSPDVKNVAWEVPKTLAKRQDYIRFLQSTGKNVKLNLQNELLLIHQVPVNKIAIVSIKIASSGDVDSIKILKSSGSQEVDMAIVGVIKDSLQYIKPPSTGILSTAVEISLSVEFN